ncbi:luciferase-like monooxygenase family protein [Mycobacterium xenopi 4042]|uniref:Luciferase-like monooxygenase family protein n=1 Tax=Mycobacterium xenopi 4042 TaxID=1299334 RepID=X7YLC7_MYCXE|nr:luciferase-like monooxygenase family protein [Mycobacterium xenopi 4042]
MWLGTRSIAADLAAQIESLGYGAAWIGGSPDADLAWVEPAAAQTSSLQLATGIVNIWSAPAAAVAESYHRVENNYPGRFLLGIGVGHPSTVTTTASPTTRWSTISMNSTPRRYPPAGGCLPHWVPRC